MAMQPRKAKEENRSSPEMAFLTTNPSPFLINVPELQNVVNNATGAGGTATITNTLNDILTYINTANAQININAIGSSTTDSVTFTSNINLSNSEILFLGSNLLSSNTLNGADGFIAFQTSGVEGARLTPIGFGIGTVAPAASLDIVGNARISGGTMSINTSLPAKLAVDISGGALIYGPLYVSSFGAASTQTGNVVAFGDVFANGVFYPSDPALKTNIRAYVSPGLPTPVEFDWRRGGARDIGVLADEVGRLEPACVIRSPAGGLTVDYAKLSVILLAEIHELKNQMSTLQARLP
jgi:hypothetical protein